MVTDDRSDTAAALSALEDTLPLFSGALQLTSMVFQFVPGMAGVAGVLGGISSAFDRAGDVLDAIGKAGALRGMVMEDYDSRHPDPAAHPRVALALIAKAVTLGQNGRAAEALAVWDDLAGRFGSDTDPLVAREVRLARISAATQLNRLQRFEETLTRCADIVERYGADPDPAVIAEVLTARLNRLLALAGLRRTAEALTCFDEITVSCAGLATGSAPALELRVRQVQVIALFLKSVLLLQQDNPDRALAACDEMVGRFGADQHAEARSAVTLSLLARAAVLHHLGRWQDEIGAYDELLATTSADRSLRDLRLGAEYGRVQALQQLGRFEDVMHACAGISREFGDDRGVTALTAMLETEGYRGLGQHKKAVRASDKAVKAWEKLARPAGPDSELAAGSWVAAVLRLKALSLDTLSRADEAQSVRDKIDRRYGDDPDLPVRQQVAQALLDKGRALAQRKRWREAAAVMDTVLARYGQDTDPVLIEMSARARSNKIALGQIGTAAAP
jgi:tetratricopeptide (TPR) repeat protein